MRGKYAKNTQHEITKDQCTGVRNPYNKRTKKITWKYLGLQLTEEQVREAMRNTRSNTEAAKWLDITRRTYRKYAKSFIDHETGKSLWDLHMNQGGIGIAKVTSPKMMTKAQLTALLTEVQSRAPGDLLKLRNALIKDGRLGYECSCCHYAERRVSDMKSPLLLDFMNGKKTDWRIENLRWLCYNCAFLISTQYFTPKFIDEIGRAHV